MELVHPFVPPRQYFVEIDAVKRIRDAMSCARSFGEPVQVISDPGYGKTMALYYLAQELGGTYCLVGQSHKKTPDMYRMLLSAFDIYHDCNYTRDLFNVLVRRLRPTSWEMESQPRRILIVDEVQTLEATALRDLLNIQETCNLALVLSGNGARLASTKIENAAWPQIESRMSMKIRLPALCRQDCQLMGAAYGVEGMDAYEAIANFGTRTTARHLGRLLREARTLTTETGGIRLHHLQAALKAKPDLADLRFFKPEAA